jgi:heme exporter protein A
MGADVLQAEGLAAFRGERLVLRDLDFTVPAGGALVLVGANGSGKSTLLRLLAGLVRPIAGRVLWGGEDTLADLLSHSERVTYLGHLDSVKLGLTAAENLRFSARADSGSVDDALKELGLGDLAEVPTRFLSAGQKRRLALARLRLSVAPLWLLVEPTVGLDAASLERVGALLRAHRARGGVVVVATHVQLPLDHVAELRLG